MRIAAIVESHRTLELPAVGADAGLARGINHALADGGSATERAGVFCVVRGDQFPAEDALRSLLAELERSPAVGLVGARVVPQDLPGESIHGSDQSLEADDVALVSGGCFLLRRSTFEDVGPFDESLVAPFDMMDFCLRARRLGWRLRAVDGLSPSGDASEFSVADHVGAPTSDAWRASRHRYIRKHHGLLAASLRDVASLGEAALRTSRSVLARGHVPSNSEVTGAARQVVAGIARSLVESDASTEGPDFVDLVREDFETHARDLTEPGFWALLAHRLGSHGAHASLGRALGARMGQRVLSTAVDWVWGIQIAETARVGRRVRIWHSGCIVVDAREIGDDVQLRHNTTIGPERGHRGPRGLLPVIGSRAELGAGACVLGAVTVGEGATVGANSVVLKDVPSGARVLGVPARPIPI